jgi:hypothetical protein
MKNNLKPIVVQVDSVIDVITNSSSELFICKTNKSVQTVEELLKEMLYGTNDLSNYIKPVSCVGDNLELFLDEHLSKNQGYGYLSYPALKNAFLGDLDELSYVVTVDGKIEPEQDWYTRHRNPKLPEQVEDELATAKYRRDKREEFLRHNNTPEVLQRLKDFVIIESSEDNSIPYEIWDNINATFNGSNWHLG